MQDTRDEASVVSKFRLDVEIGHVKEGTHES